MFKNIMNFITRIQNSPENVRKRWLVILSGISMTVVIALWLTYFNWSLPKIVEPAAADNQNNSGLSESLQNLKTTLANGWQAVKDGLGGNNFFRVNSSERNFILEKLPPAAPAKLP